MNPIPRSILCFLCCFDDVVFDHTVFTILYIDPKEVLVQNVIFNCYGNGIINLYATGIV